MLNTRVVDWVSEIVAMIRKSLFDVNTKPAGTVNSALAGLVIRLLVTIYATVSWAIDELVREREVFEFVFDSLDKGQVGGGAPLPG